ncbi:radical SAM protein [candidate division KSB1 bacterium]|nr:radical SAM protein [candidate division KSB1 bacterium]
MQRPDKSILLFNPWIYDFAAYDFWSKPLGLLQIGSLLKMSGYHIELIDCLDRFHPVLEEFPGFKPAQFKINGTGKFHREQIEKPKILDHIPRKYCRYGLPLKVVRHLLGRINRTPDAILVTSIMTYWYPAVRDAVYLLREFFPGTPIILGGIYATLCPEHAGEHIRPDYLCVGQGEQKIFDILSKIAGKDNGNIPDIHCNETPYPAYELYPNLKSVALITSRGCPNRCSFCASKLLYSGYTRRADYQVVDEISHWRDTKNVEHFAFYDDALLHNADKSFKPLLRRIIERNFKIFLHTPNGLQPRYVDPEFAELFHRAGGFTIRLSFETANPERQKHMSAKVTCRELENAVHCLKNAGFSRDNIGVYVMMGLPDQDFEEVTKSVNFVLDLGVKVNLASFSPIPQTLEWRRAIAAGLWSKDEDLLLTNTSIYPVWSKTFGFAKVEEFVYSIKEKLLSLNDNDIQI